MQKVPFPIASLDAPNDSIQAVQLPQNLLSLKRHFFLHTAPVPCDNMQVSICGVKTSTFSLGFCVGTMLGLSTVQLEHIVHISGHLETPNGLV